MKEKDIGNGWPERPSIFPGLMTPAEAAMFLRLDQTGHTPVSACRMLNYWRGRALREMLSDGRLSTLVTTSQNRGPHKTVHIEQEGPIAYVESTTLGIKEISNEDQTRFILLCSNEGSGVRADMSALWTKRRFVHRSHSYIVTYRLRAGQTKTLEGQSDGC